MEARSGRDNLSNGEDRTMSTVVIIVLVAIGLVIMMGLTDRARDQLLLKKKKDYIPSDRDSSLAGYIVAVLVLLGITVLAVRACEVSF
jgi:uncharacterized membrane protein YidH (DUF202 family)